MSKVIYAFLAVLVVLTLAGGGYLLLRPKVAKAPVATNEETMKEDQPSETLEAMMDEGMKEEVVVTLTSNGFDPNVVTIKAGEKVTWKNMSGKSATVNSSPHPIHTDYSPLNLGNFDDGESLSLVFPDAGTYTYHNHLNPSQVGKIIVE